MTNYTVLLDAGGVTWTDTVTAAGFRIRTDDDGFVSAVEFVDAEDNVIALAPFGKLLLIRES